MILISNLILSIEDGSTIASTEIYGTDKKTYINIGSGDVFKLHWDLPTLTNNDTVDHYSLVIRRYNATANTYHDILNKNIGLVNEFYVDSSILPTTIDQYTLSIYLVAYSKLGSVITSNTISPYISKGSGTYVRVQPAGYAVPIMKRAVVFANAPAPADTFARIIDAEGQEVPILDNEGNQIPVETSRLLIGEDWQLALGGYVKDPNGTWHVNDIKYEILVDSLGELITDVNNEPIYVL